MKLMIIIGCFFAVLGAGAADEYRNFTNQQGDTIRAKIIRYDAPSKKIMIARDNGKTAKVPVAIFSEADQKYITSWLKYEGVRSTSKFKISTERRKVKSWDEERLGTISYSDGSREHDQVVGKTDYDEMGYEIKLENRNKIALKGLTLEYCIFYEQQLSSRDKDPQQGVRHGMFALGDFAGQSKKNMKTESVVVFKDESDSGFTDSRVLKGDVLGVVIHIYAKEGDEKVLLRAEASPSSLLTSRKWTTQSVLLLKK